MGEAKRREKARLAQERREAPQKIARLRHVIAAYEMDLAAMDGSETCVWDVTDSLADAKLELDRLLAEKEQERDG